MRVCRGLWVRVTIAVLLGGLATSVTAVSPALAAEPLPQYERSFGPDGTEATGFEHAGPIAIDQNTHVVYVIDTVAGSLLKFDSEGDPLPFSGSAPYISGNSITGLSFFGCAGCAQVAVDSISHDVYVTSNNAITAFHADGEEALFTAGPGEGTNQIGGFNELIGLAVDKFGVIYAGDYPYTLRLFGHSGEPLTQFESEGPTVANLAVNNDGAIYANEYLGKVNKFEPNMFPVTSATTYSFAGAVDPNTSYTVAVDPASNDVYIAESSPTPRVAHYSSEGVLLGTFAAPGEAGEIATSEGVAVDGASGNIFVSNSPEGGLSQVELFAPYKGAPVIASLSVANVSADSATLRARINPGRAETIYRFEYGLSDCSLGGCVSLPAGGAGIGDGHKGVRVSQSLMGLEPDTIYHYRVVAINKEGETASTDRTFHTQTASLDFPLADGRAWEMVSPPDKHGGTVVGPGPLVQAAADGGGLIYPSIGSIEEDPESSRSFESTSILARRGQEKWLSSDLAHPNSEEAVIPISSEGEYKIFNRDLSRALLEPKARTLLSPEAYEKTPYVRLNTEPPDYEPLITPADVPPNTTGRILTIVGANRDLSHVAVTSSVPLVAGAPPVGQRSLYLWTSGRLQPLSVLPGGAIVATDLVGSGPGGLRGAISDDGSRVFWSTGEFAGTSAGNITGLYLRDTVTEETARIDVEQAGATGDGTPRPTFQGASYDGTVVFFTDSQQLTENAGTSGRDLYRCEIPSGPVGLSCTNLINLTSEMQNPGESAEVQGVAPGVSEDARTIYFVANGILDGALNEAGEMAVAQKPNLYVWHQGEDVRFIATLSPADRRDWGDVLEHEHLEHEGLLSAASSPNGRYLSFMSQRSLTGMDNIDAASGEPVQQIYRYDLATDHLDCISCKPTGAAPDGELIPVTTALRRVEGLGYWRGVWVAALLPERPAKDVTALSFYAPRATLDNGRVFFNSIDSLVPADSNSQWDVYQYEPTGTGDCTTASGGAAVARSPHGCVSLISSGTAEEEAGFLDASESGDDAFFLTPAQLNETDRDHEYDVYDARVGGVPATLPTHAECLGDACQPLAQAPSDSTPASAALEGRGNVKPKSRRCPKGKHKARRHGRTVCARKHRHRHKTHQRGARQGGRAGR